MSIKFAVLGLLCREPLSGYDLKKKIAESAALYWSGNNNQIYTTLVQLHKEGLVTFEVMNQDEFPAKKVYAVTAEGLALLKDWLVSQPELPEIRDDFLIRIAWADLLEEAELQNLIDQYEEELGVRLLIEKEKARRGTAEGQKDPRQALFERLVVENILSFYENELKWLQKVRQEVGRQEVE